MANLWKSQDLPITAHDIIKTAAILQPEFPTSNLATVSAIHDPACHRAVFSRGGALRVGRSLLQVDRERKSEWVVTL